ncbi:TPA: hypothetical protein ACH3X2_005130 [Trebouxia sp. C0005]
MQTVHCKQMGCNTTPACYTYQASPLPRSLAFTPVSAKLLNRCQIKRVHQRRRNASHKVCAAQEKDELPPWARKEKERELASMEKKDLPFGVFLLGSAIVAIAATGSWFELANKNPIFGVLGPDNPLWTVILGFFGVSGYPTAGFLFYKAIQSANKDFERADKADGY